MTGQNSTTPFTRSRTVSVQEQSSYELTTATRSPNDPAETLERVNAVLALYFETGLAPDVKALVREEFIRALEPYPDWAVQRAFDTWARTATRRPTPGDIVILASREVEPFHKELARRDRLEELLPYGSGRAEGEGRVGRVSDLPFGETEPSLVRVQANGEAD